MRKKPMRTFELDALRGLAIFMMILHHFIFDLRYIFSLDVFPFQETDWFTYLLRPFFVAVFLLVSGICCAFSRSNIRRGLRMLAAAMVLSVLTILVSRLTDLDYVIYFNVIHVIAVGTLLYAWIERCEKRKDATDDAAGKPSWTIAISVFLAITLLYLGSVLPVFRHLSSDWLLPFGLTTRASGDYLPLIPWLGFFFAGVVLGRLYYKDRDTLFPHAPEWLLQGLRPLQFFGRNALVIYLLHQPVLLGILYALRMAGVI